MKRMNVKTSFPVAFHSTKSEAKSKSEFPSVRYSTPTSKKVGSNEPRTQSRTYVDHPAFADPRIEEFLFGPDVERLAKMALPFHWPTVSGPLSIAEQAPVFSLADEQKLFMRLNFARRAVALIREGAADRGFSVEELRQLQHWEQRAADTRSLLVQVNLRLVIAMLRRFSSQKGDWSEFVSDGNVALLRCVDLFDCSRGFKFSTYCCSALFKSFNQVIMRTSRYREWFPATFSPSMVRDCDVDAGGVAADEECLDVLREILYHNLAQLNETERYVIQERFGFGASGDPGIPKTLKGIGQLLGLSKERVRQIQTKALKKVRETLNRRRLAA